MPSSWIIDVFCAHTSITWSSIEPNSSGFLNSADLLNSGGATGGGLDITDVSVVAASVSGDTWKSLAFMNLEIRIQASVSSSN